MCPFISGDGVRAGGHVPPVPPHVAVPGYKTMKNIVALFEIAKYGLFIQIQARNPIPVIP